MTARVRIVAKTHFSLTLGVALALLGGAGCRALPTLPPADLNAGGWSVRHGQAIWKPNQFRPELAGELLLATNVNGDCLIEFTKTPFVLATARQSGDLWLAQIGGGRHEWQGHGAGPRLFSWFELPHVLAGEKSSPSWRFTQTNGTWRLENWRNGEWLEGVLPP